MGACADDTLLHGLRGDHIGRDTLARAHHPMDERVTRWSS